jgi:NTP pyrophosphatase (non-canonical NTP hydrolase)
MLQRAKMNEYGLDNWVAEFNEIYKAANERRTLEGVWLHAVEHVGELHEDLRIGEYENVFRHTADMFCWLCAFVTKAHNELGTKSSLLDIVLTKYPRICFYCSSHHCMCSATIGRGIEDKQKKAEFEKPRERNAEIHRKALRDEGTEPKSLQEVVEMFRDIYDHINFRTPLEVIMAHLQEEVGEVATCLNSYWDRPPSTGEDKRKYNQELEFEIADIVTWTVALVLKLDYLLAAGKIYLLEAEQIPGGAEAILNCREKRSLGATLADILWRRFKMPDGDMLWCPRCEARPCRCKLLK